MAVIQSTTIPQARKTGKLVRVPLGGNVMIQMYEADARALGLLKDEPKARPRSQDKARRRTENKAAQEGR